MKWLIRYVLVMAAILLTIQFTVQFEQYREAVRIDTNSYLVCRNHYYNKSWEETNRLKQEYSQKMCQDDWAWWNYEVYSKKLFSRF